MQLKSGEIKLDKAPCTPIVDNRGNITGFVATRANDPTTWTTFDTAYKAHQLGLVNGVGFQFGGTYGHEAFFGIDIDNYKGCSTEVVDEILSKFKGCYIETTPNGGYHIIGKGRLLKTGKAIRSKIDDSKNFWLEGYGGDSNRYFTMTGYIVAGHEDGTPEFDAAEALTWIHETYFKEDEKPVTVKPVIRQTLERHGYSPSPSSSFDKSYQTLVDEYNSCVVIDAVLTRNGYI
jgi:primase-polymerase (primpol)-like protein